MKLLIEVDVVRVNGRNHNAGTVADHICTELILPGEMPKDPGRIWIEDAEYRVVSATPVQQRRTP